MCGRQRFDLSAPFIVIVSVDLSSKFEGSGLTNYLERLRSLEHWLVSCWCGCSQILFVSKHPVLIMYVVRPQSQGVSNWNVWFLLVYECFCNVHVIGS